MPPIDHLVWGGRDLEQEIDRLQALTGVRAALGGRHIGQGTRNALIGLGPAMYLELLAPDFSQPTPAGPRWFGLDDLANPRLITWAAKGEDLEHRADLARQAGLELGEVRRGQRQQDNGQTLCWRLTDPDMRQGDGLVPFLIDWGRSPHPADHAPGGAELVELRAEHPDPVMIGRLLRHLGIELPVSRGPTPALIAALETPRGRVELR
ncbi:MAG: VOC family protein [Gemmatimonadales bacterium]